MTCENLQCLPRHFSLRDGRSLIFDHTLIMGILNITDNSFYDCSRVSPDQCLDKAEQMLHEGADILDIGAESTRPGALEVPWEHEIERLVPVIRRLRERFPYIPISADTRKSQVAAAALEAGADIINDVSGFQFDSQMPKTIAVHGGKCILMHAKGLPENMQISPSYHNVIEDIINYFKNQIDVALKNDILRESIILDPGIGFGKMLFHNTELIRNINDFSVFRMPLLIGASRKVMIGEILNLPQPQDRLEGTLAVTALCAWQGVHIIRVHDVLQNVRVARVCDAIKGVYC